MLVKRNDLRLGVVNGERGRVVAIDTEAHQLTLDCHGARVTLDADYLDDRTVHGEPSLLHGYAMTIHVAQGLTVNHAFLLAGLGLDREAGYTALSRGRETNHIYAARDKETPRGRVRTHGAREADPVRGLISALERSSASTLAIDTGHADRLADAYRDLAGATSQRRAAEAARGSWLPRRRRQLEQLRCEEAAAETRVNDRRREQEELHHGARPFVTERELDARSSRASDRLAEVRLQRELERNMRRGLER